MTWAINIRGNSSRIVKPVNGSWVTVLGVSPKPNQPVEAPPTDATADTRPDLVSPRHDPVPPESGSYRNIATLASQTLNRATVPSDGSLLSLTKHVLTSDVTSLTVAWEVTTGWYTASSGGTYRMWIEGAGLTTPLNLTFGGKPTVNVVAPTNSTPATYTSDPVSVSWISGDRITVGVEVVASAGVTVPADSTGLRKEVDPTSSEASIRPSRIVAKSDRPAFVIIGDSIAQQPYSYGEQAVSKMGIAGVKSAVGGDGYVYWKDGSGGGRYTGRVSQHAPYATHVLDTLGANDTNYANAIATWRYIRRNSNLKIVKSTIHPTHKFRTYSEAILPENQSASREPRVHDFNEWLRDGAPISSDWSTALPAGTSNSAIRCTVVSYDGSSKIVRNEGHLLDSVIEASAAVELSRENPVYSEEALSIIGQGDALHPAPGVHSLMANRMVSDLKLLGY